MAFFKRAGRYTLERKNYYAIDVAKFISAFLVVCIHTGPLLDINKEANFVLVQIIARLAVPFFFVASGFLFFRKIDTTREWNDYENVKAVRRYIWRLLKIYIIWSILYLPFVYYLMQDGEGFTLSSFLIRYIRDFFFTGSFYHLWFLPALLLAVPFVYLLVSKWSLKTAMYIGILLYVVGMSINVYPQVLDKIPYLNTIIKGYLAIFSTTRNGFFFGTIFVALGAFFAKRRIYLKNYQVIIGFIISLMLLFVECFLLRANGFMKDLSSMYITLLPCLFFMFLILLRIHLKESRTYKTMRILSLLIYVSHLMFVNCILWELPAMNSLIVYLLAMICSLVFSCIVIIVSRKLVIFKHLYQ